MLKIILLPSNPLLVILTHFQSMYYNFCVQLQLENVNKESCKTCVLNILVIHTLRNTRGMKFIFKCFIGAPSIVDLMLAHSHRMSGCKGFDSHRQHLPNQILQSNRLTELETSGNTVGKGDCSVAKFQQSDWQKLYICMQNTTHTEVMCLMGFCTQPQWPC